MSTPNPPSFELVPNERVRARLDGLSAEDVEAIAIRFGRHKDRSTVKVSERSTIVEIFDAFKASSRPKAMQEDLQSLKQGYDAFVFYFRPGSRTDRVQYRVHHPAAWGPSVEAICDKYRPTRERPTKPNEHETD